MPVITKMANGSSFPMVNALLSRAPPRAPR